MGPARGKFAAGRPYLARNFETRFRKPAMRSAPKPKLMRREETINETIRTVPMHLSPPESEHLRAAPFACAGSQDRPERLPCQVNKYEKAAAPPGGVPRGRRLEQARRNPVPSTGLGAEPGLSGRRVCGASRPSSVSHQAWRRSSSGSPRTPSGAPCPSGCRSGRAGRSRA